MENSARRTLAWEGGQLTYRFTQKAVKNINLRVTNGEVRVSAPRRLPIARVEAFLIEKQDWIQKALAHQVPTRQAPQDTLAPKPGTSEEEKAFEKAFLPVFEEEYAAFAAFVAAAAKAPCPALTRAGIAPARQTAFWQQTAYVKRGGRAPQIAFRAMTSRWGSCTPASGRIRFSTMLAQKSEEDWRGVIDHELIHLLATGHGKLFHALLDAFDPANRTRRRALIAR